MRVKVTLRSQGMSNEWDIAHQPAVAQICVIDLTATDGINDDVEVAVTLVELHNDKSPGQRSPSLSIYELPRIECIVSRMKGEAVVESQLLFGFMNRYTRWYMS